MLDQLADCYYRLLDYDSAVRVYTAYLAMDKKLHPQPGEQQLLKRQTIEYRLDGARRLTSMSPRAMLEQILPRMLDDTVRTLDARVGSTASSTAGSAEIQGSQQEPSVVGSEKDRAMAAMQTSRYPVVLISGCLLVVIVGAILIVLGKQQMRRRGELHGN